MIQSKEEHWVPRLYELDLLKAVSIVSMILCRCVIRLGLHQPDYERDICYWIGDYVFGCYLGVAHAFMFAMGVGVVYSRRNSPAELVRRGVRLYILGFVDSIFCYLLGVVFPWPAFAAAPGGSDLLTRGEFVAALFDRMGATGKTGQSAFEDVPADGTLARAVAWSAANGIVNG